MYYFYLATHILKLAPDTYFSMSLKQFFDYLEIHYDYQRELHEQSNTTSKPKEQPKTQIKNLGNFLRGGN